MPATLLRPATVMDPSSAYYNQTVTLRIDGGIIQEINPVPDGGHPEPQQRSAATILTPGFVDLFADYREPGYEQKETIATGLDTAAAGGFTDVLLLPNTAPVTDGRAGVQYALQQSRSHAVRLHPLGAVSQGIGGKALAEMLDMRSHGAIAFTDGWKPVQSAPLMGKALEYVKAFDGVVLQLPMDAALSAGGLMHEGAASTRLGMPGSPSLAEYLMAGRDIELARYTGSRLHLTGVSTKESVALIRRAKAEGVQVTCSVTPYHLMLTDEALNSYDSLYKLTPPLRTGADRQALIEGLADGTIDCIASHHRPQDWDAKAKEFEYAGEGMAIQNIAFAVARTAVGSAVPLSRLIDAFAIAPRRIFGLPAPRLEKGAAAAFTLVAPDESFIYSAESTPSLSRNNPFGGMELTGKIEGIITPYSA